MLNNLHVAGTAGEGESVAGQFPCFRGRNLRIEVKAGETGLRDVRYAVGRVAADVQHDRAGEAVAEFLVDFEQELPIGLGGAGISGGMVGEAERVRAGLDLRDSELHGDFFQRGDGALDLVGFQQRVDEEFLDPEHVVAQRPGPEDFAHNRDLGVAPTKERDGLPRGAGSRAA